MTKVKTPKGTRDWNEDDIALRNEVFDTIRKVFALHGGTEIDTSVFELKSLVTDKYGENSKLIYDLEDQDGELLALRYDLTVPFARWMAMNNTRIIKRFQIGKVYRRDHIARGRMREFFQCDFDYAGDLDLMVPDTEVICITTEVFQELDIPVTVRINHRLILDGLFTAVGVPQDQLRTTSSAMNKMNKLPWRKVKEEMIQKGLPEDVAVKLGKYLVDRTNRETDNDDVLELLKSDALLSKNKNNKQGVEEMELFLRYMKTYGVTEWIQLDLSLARGLDYYTGLMYEVILDPGQKGRGRRIGKLSRRSYRADAYRPVCPKEFSEEALTEALCVGSIAAGGRYDKLVGKLSSRDIPCVGMFFGIDRILTVLKSIESAKQINSDSDTNSAKPRVSVWIIIASNNPRLIDERMEIARDLRRWAMVSVDFDAKADRKPQKQLEVAKKNAETVLYLEEDDEEWSGVRIKILEIEYLFWNNLDNADINDRGVLTDCLRR
jgi:histidyl-tRNA synthetase